MLATFVGATSDESSFNGGNVEVSLPAGVQVGDQLLVGIAWTTAIDPPVAPSGWIVLDDTSYGSGSGTLRVWARTAEAGDPSTAVWQGEHSSFGYAWSVVAYRDHLGVEDTAAAASAGRVAQWPAPSVVAEFGQQTVLSFWVKNGGGDVVGTDDGSTARIAPPDLPHVYEKPGGPGVTEGTLLAVDSSTAEWAAVSVGLHPVALPPYAPDLLTMADGGTVDRSTTQRARHVFADGDPGDSQSAFDLRYRIVGAPTWTTIHAVTPNPWYDFPAGTFAAGDYERQVRCYDASGLVGPWSASGFFTAGDTPAGPTITYPVNGATVQQSDYVAWSIPDQDAYQVRRLGDNAGAPDESVVYEDTGQVNRPGDRFYPMVFLTNNRPEHIQVRVLDGGLWSPWASVAVDVSWSPPPTPLLTVTPQPGTGSLLLTITNPDPTGDDPAAVSNDVWIDDGNGEERKAAMLPTNTAWPYWTPRSGRDYAQAVRVVAVAANGVTSSSEGVS